ncbi:MAG TPA: S9 family peptidase [Acidimicrobiales bacterium]|nr:S9 family peptidase [Acidimicrobiales bacterium]
MQPAGILDVVELSDPRVHPDGRTIAFVATTPDLDQNAYRSAVWVSGIDGEFPACPFTDGDARERTPRWSPDGQWLAYVAHPDETGCRLRVADVDGGDTYELLEWPEDIDEVVWTPDGTRLVFTTRERDEATYGPEKDKHRPARTIDRLSYRTDSIGWTVDRPKHVFVIAADGAAGGTPIALTSGPFQDGGIAVSPDGRWVAFSSARTSTWDTDLSSHLYRVALDGSSDEPEPLTIGLTTHTAPSWSPDGRSLAFVWGDRHSMMRHSQIGVVELESTSPDEELMTTALDLHCAPYLAHAREPAWVGNDELLFQVDEAGNVPVYRVSRDGAPSVVVGGDRQIVGFDVAGGSLAFVASTATHPTELFVLVDGLERQLTKLGDPFVKRHAIGAPERFTATSRDGSEVEAWLIRPVDADPGALHPTLLFIHGGPFSQYGNRLFDEFQVAAAAGYVVVYSNPRGSSGYSETFARGIRGPKAPEDPGTGWGGADFEDLMAVMDAAVEGFDCIDAERLGVLGGSYGGYMTSWIIGHDDRFKAACSERACNNLFTFAHTSDIGASFPAGYIGASHLDDPEEFLRQSPVTYYRDMATPLLIVHSENDLRCPIEQAEDLFVRLKMTGRDVEFVRFPGESHELSRTGAPRHRIQRLELILDWFARKL